MSAISTILTRLRAAIWAIDVRDDIANAIEQCYSDVSNPTLKTEALEAALQNKIDEGEMAALTIGDGTITAAKFASGVIDNTLATSGAAADAKKTGDEIAAVKADLDAVENDISALEVLSPAIKNALLGAFEHVMWFEGCSEYYDALVDALYTDIPVIKIYRGMGVSGASIVANEKRMLSDPIPFVNEAPITIRVIGENNDYAYNPKFINTQNGIVTSVVGENGNIVYFYDSDGVSKAFRADDSECTLMTDSPRVASKVYSSVSGEVVSGYLRLLFADGSDIASELPTTQIPKYAVIQGIRYRLEEANDTPVIKVYRGIGTSGENVVTNTKRMLSDPIPFVNEVPITIRVIGENNDYAYNPKFINTQNGIITSTVGESGDNVYFYDSDGVSKAFRADDSECTLMTNSPRVASKVYSGISGEVVSGYLRLLFADGSDIASELPTTQIPKYAVIQGIVYGLEENNT